MKKNYSLLNINEIKGMLFYPVINFFNFISDDIIKEQVENDEFLFNICKKRINFNVNKFYNLIKEVILSDKDLFEIHNKTACFAKEFFSNDYRGDAAFLGRLIRNILDTYPTTFIEKIFSNKIWKEIEKELIEQIDKVKLKH